jgi:hypothetical protein
MTNYLTINLMGGLGNQLFQIFTTLSLALKYKIPFKFKYSDILTTGINRPTYWNNFLKSLKVFTLSDFNTDTYLIYREKSFTFDLINLDNHCHLVKTNGIKLFGYFQSYKYFEDNYNNIKKLIKLDETIINIKNKYSNYFIDDNITVSIHFRLGDYKNIQDYHPIMNYDYYKNSLDLIMKENKNKIINILYFCEKEDNQYVLDTFINPLKIFYNNYININSMNINNPLNFIKVDDNIEDWEQLIIMANCHHNIIANSSFSWWGAYFNQNSNKIVCYPSIWFGEKANNNTKDLCPNNWIKVH